MRHDGVMNVVWCLLMVLPFKCTESECECQWKMIILAASFNQMNKAELKKTIEKLCMYVCVCVSCLISTLAYLLSCSKQGSHTRTSFSMPNLGIVEYLEEHLPQKICPHALQWCWGTTNSPHQENTNTAITPVLLTRPLAYLVIRSEG